MGARIDIEGVSHEYGRTDETAAVLALERVDLQIEPGSLTVLTGPSGSGKSTILNLIGAIDRPTAGRISIDDIEITSLSERELTLLRRTTIGYVFQFFNLIPTLSVRENLEFPLALNSVPAKTMRYRVDEVLEETGLTHRASHFPNALSGGEMQRVAIGRAIVHRPKVILADEPTGNLDTKTGARILSLLQQLHATYSPTIIMATHSLQAAAIGQTIYEVLDGTARLRDRAS